MERAVATGKRREEDCVGRRAETDALVGQLEPPNIAKLGEGAAVEITFFVSPFAQLASILMSSPGPVGMFLICNAAITEPPHLVSG